MARTAKPALRRAVAAWLDELDECFEERDEHDSITGVSGKRKALVHPPLAGHVGRLHALISADYSPIVQQNELEKYERRMKKSGKRVPLKRKEFPAGYYWTIIKKWDRTWGKLRVIRRIRQYVRALPEFWNSYWEQHGGSRSPYVQQWIHCENLLDAYRYIYRREPSEKERAGWDQQFPAVAIIRRCERGEEARATDLAELKRCASPWWQKQAMPRWGMLDQRLSRLKMPSSGAQDGIQEIRGIADALHANLLAKDILAEQQKAQGIVRHWNEDLGLVVSGYFRELGNAEYIRELQAILPLRRVGDPNLEQKKRISESKRASEERKQSSEAMKPIALDRERVTAEIERCLGTLKQHRSS